MIGTLATSNPLNLKEGIDITVLRENTEDLYSGVELRRGVRMQEGDRSGVGMTHSQANCEHCSIDSRL